MKKQNKEILISCFVLFFLFLALAFMFPYTGDDWAWGSEIGLERLKVFFQGYNGRYLGNLLVFTLTRNKVLDAVVMAVSYVMLCYVCYAYSPDKSKLLIWAAAVLFFIMPKSIWTQSIVWTAGYSNYVPSTLISTVFLLSAGKFARTDLPEAPQKKLRSVWMFLLGFCGGLFIENITVFNIYFAAGVILYGYIRFRKYYAEHVAFFAGSVVGAVTMFSNVSYGAIVRGENDYWQTPQDAAEMVEVITEHIKVILSFLIYDNLLLCGIVTVLLVLLAVTWKKSGKNNAGIGLVPLVFHIVSFLLVCCTKPAVELLQKNVALPEMAELLLVSAIALLYVASVFPMVLCYVEKERHCRMLLPLFGVMGSLMPLVVADPIGPRCIFCGYIFLMIFAVDLIGYLRNRWIPAEKWFTRAACLAAVAQTLMFASIFYPIAYYDHVRQNFVKNQSAAGEELIWVFDLPNSDYLWNSVPRGSSLSERYKYFYDLDQSLEIRELPYEELEWMVEEYR